MHVTSSEGSISISSSTCQCTSWLSMRLPCRHILAVGMNLGLDLFDQALEIGGGLWTTTA